MISRKYRASELVGRKCRLAEGYEIRNGAGQGITRSTVCTIVDASYGITIKTEPCPHCGQYCYIRRVDRKELDLIPD